MLAADRRAAKKIVFSGVGKSRDEMTAALKAGILLFNVESESELSALAECATRLRKVARVALRVNPDVAADTHPYISTGLRKHKFGVPIGSARALYAKASGSAVSESCRESAFISARRSPMSRLLPRPWLAWPTWFASCARTDTGSITSTPEAGLASPIRNRDSEFADDVAKYARAVINPLARAECAFAARTGTVDCGACRRVCSLPFFTEKKMMASDFLIVDAAMNDLIRPALYGAYHEIVPVCNPVRSLGATKEERNCRCGRSGVRVWRLLRARPGIARVEEGDLLAILDAGAYGMALASNYNTRPRPAEVLVSGKSVKFIRRREKVRELYSAEL